ncbi:MAG: response regulator transcription factor [Bacteroidales bacterium]|nr:response regulator transcription factor [Bacteroidales bacterium]
MKKKHILMVEDDHNFGSVLKAYLEINDYEVNWVDDGRHAIREFSNANFDICVLDVMLPNVDGFTIAQDIRKLNQNVPFIFVTAKTLKEDVLKGYATGADDYITKPFDSEVLLLKIQAILKRSGQNEPAAEPEDIYDIGRLKFMYLERLLKVDEKTIRMSPKEADLLKMLCQYKNKVLPRELALRSIWGDDNYFTTRSMDVYITKLRKYLKSEEKAGIMNIHGNGYRLIVQDQKA